ncbi:MAG TPA: glutathione peroxidase [Panacibacter sp.]|nr:glutathione peroxidase [Panacibacter sp.]
MFKNKIIKKLTFAAVIITVLLVCVKQKNMTLRQSLLKTFYPVLMFTSKVFAGNNAILQNQANAKPLTSFYNLKAVNNKGQTINFETFKGKKVLIVNTASNCGYTGQYEELEKLQDQYKAKLVIIGFPANDFKDQETGTDEDIAAFCKTNFGVSFLLMKKSTVIKTAQQNEVFQWLTDKNKNGWNSRPPEWNFSKYLVDENGILLSYFPPAISPLDNAITAALK